MNRVKNYCNCVFAILFCGLSFVHAQDSLSALSDDTIKVRLLLSSAQKLSFGDDRSAIQAQQALVIAEKKNFIAGQRSAAGYLGTYYFVHGNYEKALNYYTLSLNASEKLNMPKEAASMMMGIGLTYYAKTDLERSLTWHLRSLKIRENIGDTAGISASYIHLANLYQYRQDLDKAMQYNLKALEIKKKLNDKDGQIYCNGNLGGIFGVRKNYLVSLEYYEEALKLSRETGNERLIANTLANIGSVYQSLQRFQKAMECLNEALEISKRIEDLEGQASTLNIIGSVYSKNQKHAQAIESLEKSLSLASQMGALELMKLDHQMLAELYSGKKENDKAYFHVKEYAMLKDSILNIKNQESLNRLQELYQSEKKDKDLLQKDHEIERQGLQNSRQSLIIVFVVLMLLLTGGFTLAMFNRLKLIRKQKILIEEKQKEIFDSITYAKRIQQALLASRQILDENLGDYFVFFKPKDIVSGDFYWASKLNNGSFAMVTADSTGHGVPGAIMSLLNITSLEKAVERSTQPSDILNNTRKTIIERLRNDGSAEGGKDGMDCSICVYDFKKNKLSVSAANSVVWIMRRVEENKGSADLEILEINVDKMPVGKHDKDTEPFSQTEVELRKGDVIYTVTDGFADQFGGEKGKKFMSKNLKELLVKNCHLQMTEQRSILENALNNWIGDLEQVDDVTVIGIRI
jgi:serine phosphatase RsbU (regulator of sigma subunit)/Tfp pilus assembly protein PilF